MRIEIIALVIAGLAGPAAAQSTKKASAAPAVQQAPAAPAAPDPVQEFERLVKQCQAVFEKQLTPAIVVSYNSRVSAWVRTVRSFEVRYDVKKTDSLVTPVIGQLSTLKVSASEQAADEESAKALNFTISSSPKHVRERYEATFVWRDGTWRFKEGTSTLDFRREDGNYHSAMRSAIDESKGWDYYGPYGKCFHL